MTEKKCILVCAGDFVPMDLAREEGDLLIAVDGGLKYLEQMGVLPDHIVGDFDSVSEEGRRVLEEIERMAPEKVTRLPVAKDDTDAIAAVRLGLERGYRRFYIYGGYGGRMDHMLANLQTLSFICMHGGRGYMIDPNQMLTVVQNDSVHFHEQFEGRIAVLALDEEVRDVTIRGMKYETDRAVLHNTFPLGVSNEKKMGAPAQVSVGSGMAAVWASWED